MDNISSQHQLLWLALRHIPKLGPVSIRKQFAAAGSIVLLWESLDLTNNQRSQFLDLARQEIESLDQLGAKVLTLDDSAYPDRLRGLPDISPVLYVKGLWSNAWSTDPPTVAVVGTRQPSAYGRDVTEKMVSRLVASGVTVVSGMALGIDSLAHEVCLQAGGQTMAVWGSGLDQVYPPRNRDLAGRIAESGVIITQFPLGTDANSYTFPVRNRLIAGLSQAVLVTEAKAKSGSLLTARAARDYGRAVWAVPGSIFNQGSQGTHQLIQEGASLAVDAAAIVNSIGAVAGQAPQASQLTFASADSAQEERLLQLLQTGPQPIDQLIRASRQLPAEILATLSLLELKGIVKQTGDGEYRISS